MSNRPIIGITPKYDTVNKNVYTSSAICACIYDNGGLPVILPLLDKDEDISNIVDHLDGILFQGGVDIDPSLFGEEKLFDNVEIAPERDMLELKLAKLAYGKDKSVLGICRGIQVLNVALGGTLYQDLPSQLNLHHRQTGAYPEDGHDVNIYASSFLSDILGDEKLRTNTYHHQSIRDVAKDLKQIAASDDYVVEAVYAPSKTYYLGIQWHPELLYGIDDRHKAIFTSFILSCKR